MINKYKERFAFVKPSLDAHTLGISSIAELVRDCGYQVLIADESIEKIINDIKYEANQRKLIDWVRSKEINSLGISYRLDEDMAVSLVGYLMNTLKNGELLSFQGGPIEQVLFAGLPRSCQLIDKEHKGFVKTFKGGESISESLSKLDIPKERIPKSIMEGSRYDDLRMEFGQDLIKEEAFRRFDPIDRSDYKDYGSKNDSVIKRLNAPVEDFAPLMRAHVGPYSSGVKRIESVKEFASWVKELAQAGYLDIVSIGSSQLTQSNFGEDWGDMPNGGGVPINSPQEYRMIWEAARPLLLRTYAGTKNIPELARIYEETINMSWHALSLWWFNKLDERGPYDLYTNLIEHMKTIKYIATSKKPFEANVSHHFAFRGADDVSYIVSAYLAAKLAKKLGIRTYILQNMLNTPRLTWGLQDLAKSRAMIKLIKSLEDDRFKVLLQPRAGLDYFKPDLEEAKIQLAAVSALMDDIDPHNELSPPIIHVVSYSEAVHLATPDIINESIQITQSSLKEYRRLRKQCKIEDMSKNLDIEERMEDLLSRAKLVIGAIEEHIDKPYSPEGFYKIFAAGFLPVPYLWGQGDEFKFTKYWKTKPVKGGVKTVDENGQVVKQEAIVDFALGNMAEVDYILKQK